MPADGTRAQLIADRQHVLEKIGRDAKRCQRCPFRFQPEQFRRDVAGQQLGHWAEGSGRAVVALAMVETRARGGDIAEDGAISDLATGLAAQLSSAAGAACALGAIGSALRRDDFLLQFQEQILALADRQSDFASGIGALVKSADLRRVSCAVRCGDRDCNSMFIACRPACWSCVCASCARMIVRLLVPKSRAMAETVSPPAIPFRTSACWTSVGLDGRPGGLPSALARASPGLGAPDQRTASELRDRIFHHRGWLARRTGQIDADPAWGPTAHHPARPAGASVFGALQPESAHLRHTVKTCLP